MTVAAETAPAKTNVARQAPQDTGREAAAAVVSGEDAETAVGGPDSSATARVSQPSPPGVGQPREATGSDRTPPLGMLLVPAGPFTMGADAGGEQDEHPAHVVTLPAYWLDATEVTMEAYGECVAQKACRPNDPSVTGKQKGSFLVPGKPIVGVSWDDARTYCSWRGKRLPREAEFEKACRGTEARRFPWGEADPTKNLTVFGRVLGVDATDVVGSHPEGRGPYGHHDMAGNVWEWIEDAYDPYAYRRPGAGRGEPGSCTEILDAQDELRALGRQGFTGSNPIPRVCEHVLRGGAFNYDAPGLRCSNRVHHPGTFRLVMSGFRCAKDASLP